MVKRLCILVVIAAALGGCAVPQAQDTPAWQRHEFDPATGRGYYIYVPSRYRHDVPAPLIVSCHGTPPFDIAEHHIREWKMLGEQYGCIVVTPVLTGTDGIIGAGPSESMLANERGILSLISLLGYRYNIDRNNVMITGFSGGGFPTYWVGLRHPDVFSVVVARNCNFNEGNLDGWYPPEARDLDILVYWGDRDPFPVLSQSKWAVRYLRGAGFTLDTIELPDSGHERRPDVAMAFFRKHWHPARPSMPTGTTRTAGGR
jgi:poly(3-hydroxybutyrate) depolymerase